MRSFCQKHCYSASNNINLFFFLRYLTLVDIRVKMEGYKEKNKLQFLPRGCFKCFKKLAHSAVAAAAAVWRNAHRRRAVAGAGL